MFAAKVRQNSLWGDNTPFLAMRQIQKTGKTVKKHM